MRATGARARRTSDIRGRRRVVIADYAGHPFQVELSRALARRGLPITHMFCPDVPTGQGDLSLGPADPARLEILPVSIGQQVQRYVPWRRVLQEFEWGVRLSRAAIARNPAAAVLSNVPLISQLVVAARLRFAGVPHVLWQQDVHSRAIGAVARRRLGRIGPAVGRLASMLESLPARSASMVMTISPAFAPVLRSWRVRGDRIRVFPNWAPLHEVQPVTRDNAWRRNMGLGDRPVILYAGTLGLKHDPSVLVTLAEQIPAVCPGATLVVISEGIGREYLDRERAARPELPIVTLDYQLYDVLPEVLGAADVLVVILEEDAGQFSIPSKVLTYLCAGRPILGVLPPDNAAADVIRESGGGAVVPSGKADASSLARVLSELLDPARVEEYGLRARAYAEAAFDVERKADDFLDALRAAGIDLSPL